MNILFRADASMVTGTGHVIRCLTLADELVRRGANTSFICRETEGNLIGLIEKKGHTVHTLPADINMDTDRELTFSLLEQQGQTGWLIADHYEIDSEWESPLRRSVKNIMVIDDLADRKHDCDLLLDQNYCHDHERYRQLVPDGCTTLLGPEYTLLRPQFTDVQSNLREHTGEIRRILVFMGGGDTTDQTSRVLRAIQGLNQRDIEVDVVIGSSNPNRSEIETLASGMPHTTCYYDVEDMAGLMSAADLSIGAGKVCDHILQKNTAIQLRDADTDDCGKVFEWRNHPDTRKYCFDESPLIFEDHEKWFLKKLKSPDTALLIGEINNSAAGVLRYDFKDNKALVSIYLSPDLKNRGIGTEMLTLGNSWIMENHTEVVQIIAEIKNNNSPSIKAFTRAGYKETPSAYIFDCKAGE